MAEEISVSTEQGIVDGPRIFAIGDRVHHYKHQAYLYNVAPPPCSLPTAPPSSISELPSASTKIPRP
jgi:hypothetical protein